MKKVFAILVLVLLSCTLFSVTANAEDIVYQGHNITMSLDRIEQKGADVEFILLIENNSEKNYEVSTSTYAVNGLMNNGFTYVLRVDVSAGKKAYGTLTVKGSLLASRGITDIRCVDTIIEFRNKDSWSDKFEEIIELKTESYDGTHDRITGEVLATKNGFTIDYIERKANDFVYCVTNDTDQYVRAYINELNVNDFSGSDVLSIFSVSILPYCQAYTSIEITDDYMSLNRFSGIDNLEWSMKISTDYGSRAEYIISPITQNFSKDAATQQQLGKKSSTIVYQGDNITNPEPIVSQEPDNTDEVPSGIEVRCITSADGKIAALITNNSDRIIDDLDIQLLFYDKNGNVIGTNKDGHDMILPGYTVVSKMDPPKSYSSFSPKVSIELDCNPNYVNHSENVAVKGNDGDNCIIVQITNNSEYTIKEIEYIVLFYNGADLVSIQGPKDVMNTPSGDTIYEEVRAPKAGYTYYDIYINQAHTFEKLNKPTSSETTTFTFSPNTNKPQETAAVSTDKAFLADFAEGLTERWDTLQDDNDQIEYFLQLVQGELKHISLYAYKQFEDERLGTYAHEYIAALKAQETALLFYSYGYTDDLFEEYYITNGYNKRVQFIFLINALYGIDLPERHKDNLQLVLNEGKEFAMDYLLSAS